MGSTVYNGPAHRAQEYFESLGFEFPSQANPIDIAMDIVMGQHGMQMNPDFQPYDLCILWIKNNRAPKRFTDLELENRTKTASLQFFSQLKVSPFLCSFTFFVYVQPVPYIIWVS